MLGNYKIFWIHFRKQNIINMYMRLTIKVTLYNKLYTIYILHIWTPRRGKFIHKRCVWVKGEEVIHTKVSHRRPQQLSVGSIVEESTRDARLSLNRVDSPSWLLNNIIL